MDAKRTAGTPNIIPIQKKGILQAGRANIKYKINFLNPYFTFLYLILMQNSEYHLSLFELTTGFGVTGVDVGVLSGTAGLTVC